MKRRRLLGFTGTFLAIVLLGLGLLQTQFFARFLLSQAGRTLGLELSTSAIHYQLRGTPALEVSGLSAKQIGQDTPLLKSQRIEVTLPWQTLRNLGAPLVLERIALDAPVLDIPALQRWLASRPSAETTQLPTLRSGLSVHQGQVRNNDWDIENITLTLPHFVPTQLMQLRVSGRYIDAPLQANANLHIDLDSPEALLNKRSADLRSRGTLDIHGDGWNLSTQISLAGPLRIGKDSVLLKPAKIGIAGRYAVGTTQTSFKLSLDGPMLFDDANWRFVPVAVTLQGDNLVPSFTARGQIAAGRELRLRLDGTMAHWPSGWPALPVPLSANAAPYTFTLRYTGTPDLANTTQLTLQQDKTHFEATFQLPDVLRWIDGNNSTPLPPLTGKLTTPRIEMSGVILEGVEVELDSNHE